MQFLANPRQNWLQWFFNMAEKRDIVIERCFYKCGIFTNFHAFELTEYCKDIDPNPSLVSTSQDGMNPPATVTDVT
jgi:hypothetical protein